MAASAAWPELTILLDPSHVTYASLVAFLRAWADIVPTILMDTDEEVSGALALLVDHADRQITMKLDKHHLPHVSTLYGRILHVLNMARLTPPSPSLASMTYSFRVTFADSTTPTKPLGSFVVSDLPARSTTKLSMTLLPVARIGHLPFDSEHVAAGGWPRIDAAQRVNDALRGCHCLVCWRITARRCESCPLLYCSEECQALDAEEHHYTHKHDPAKAAVPSYAASFVLPLPTTTKTTAAASSSSSSSVSSSTSSTTPTPSASSSSSSTSVSTSTIATTKTDVPGGMSTGEWSECAYLRARFSSLLPRSV